jgi:hypothetical protein
MLLPCGACAAPRPPCLAPGQRGASCAPSCAAARRPAAVPEARSSARAPPGGPCSLGAPARRRRWTPCAAVTAERAADASAGAAVDADAEADAAHDDDERQRDAPTQHRHVVRNASSPEELQARTPLRPVAAAARSARPCAAGWHRVNVRRWHAPAWVAASFVVRAHAARSARRRRRRCARTRSTRTWRTGRRCRSPSASCPPFSASLRSGCAHARTRPRATPVRAWR